MVLGDTNHGEGGTRTMEKDTNSWMRRTLRWWNSERI